MTYDELVATAGFQPNITIEKWQTMNAEERLTWLAVETKRRDLNWRKTVTFCSQAWGAKTGTAGPPAAPQPQLSKAIVLAAIVYLALLLGLLSYLAVAVAR